MLTRCLAAVCGIVMLTTAGCRGGGDGARSDDDGPTTSSTVATEPLSDNTMTRTLTVKVAGAKTFEFSGPTQMRFVLRSASGRDRALSVASVTVIEPLQASDGYRVSPEIGLVGLYTGDGDYEVPAGVGQTPPSGPKVDPPGDSSSVSVGQVTFFRLSPVPVDQRFGYVLEPCKVTLRAKGTQGSATCPVLIAYDGERVSLAMTWGD